MGTFSHNAIVVTCWDNDHLIDAHEKAEEVFEGDLVSEIVAGQINGYSSFFVAPDGSKEGWEASKERDVQRDEFTSWLHDNRERNYCAWIEVMFGEFGCKVVRSYEEY